MKAFTTLLSLLSIVAPFAAATAVQSQSSSCEKNEFWYSKKSCCLPNGGPPAKPTPPAGNECPSSGYYWGQKQGCCVPSSSPRDNEPEPSCPKNWTWVSADQRCEPVPSSSTAHTTTAHTTTAYTTAHTTTAYTTAHTTTAHSTTPSATPTGSKCAKNEFWYSKKSCCLPNGGPPSKPTPPAGSDCPPAGYYWGHEQGCCVPTSSPPSNEPEPSCPKNWTWVSVDQRCEPAHSSSTAHTTTPYTTAHTTTAHTTTPYTTAHTTTAHSTTPSATPTGSTCAKNEFWYSKKSCCLPNGGPPSKPTPPSGSECPPSGYYWGHQQGCCVPTSPPPPNGPEPQCPKNWTWVGAIQKCEPNSPSNPHSTPPSQPSSYGNHHNNGWRKKRSLRSRKQTRCPTGLDACPIYGSLTGDYECIDKAVELESCGGCASTGEGQDCTAIKGAWNVGCESGVCAVYTCAQGFKRSADAKSCIPL